MPGMNVICLANAANQKMSDMMDYFDPIKGPIKAVCLVGEWPSVLCTGPNPFCALAQTRSVHGPKPVLCTGPNPSCARA